MSESDLNQLERSLSEFHNNKPILVALGIYTSLEDLNRVKKLHMATHYCYAIREMGTPDGYNMELPEHLHIIYAKRGWCASSKVCPLPQMVKFIQHYEALRIQCMYIDLYYGCQVQVCPESQVVYGEDEDAIAEGKGHRLVDQDEELTEDLMGDEGSEGENEGEDEDFKDEPEGELVRIQSGSSNDPGLPLDPEWSIAIEPTAPHTSCNEIMGQYGASDFVLRTNEWLQESMDAGILPLLQLITDGHTVDVWHKFYLHHRLLHFDPDLAARRDAVRAQPPRASPGHSLRYVRPGIFDTVLFLARPKDSGIRRYRAGRVRLIFKLPAHLSSIYPHPLVYLELFTSFSGDFNSSHRMHTISHDMHCSIRRTIVMPLVWVVAACHLAPVFSQFDQDFAFDSCDVLSTGKHFYFNHFSSNFMFGLVDHWRMIQDRDKEAKVAEQQAREAEARRARAARGKAACARLTQIRNETSSS
ncbi:hypothetical protein OPQ81_011867 [Rhizoctonia solani]|nr:hypothetical protein OPQ81_011867 [Rhizoctonia solani]